MAKSQQHLLAQPDHNITVRTKFERESLPTLLELRVGSPAQIKGLTLTSQSLKNFAESAKFAIKEIGSVHFRVMDDHTLTEGAKLVRSATHAETKIKAARAQFGRIADPAIEKINSLQKELRSGVKPPSSAGEAAIDSELRALIRSELDAGKQLSMIRSDPAMRAAVARAPAVLSGLKAEIHDSIQAEHMRAIDPETFEIFEDLQSALKSADMALRAIEDQGRELVDFETAQALDSKRVGITV